MVDKPDTSSKEREPEEEPSQAPGDEITTVQEPAPILNGEAGNRSETPPNKKAIFPSQPLAREDVTCTKMLRLSRPALPPLC